MRIAIPYENGKVFSHFGKSQMFKIYNVDNNLVASTELVESNGAGHDAIAGMLAANDVNVVICGGIGEHATAALDAAGIQIISGAEGAADEAVAAFIAGDLESQGTNCDHHSEGHGCGGCGHHEDEEESCCGGNEGGCGSGCGGCGHHEMQIIFEGKNAGKTVKAHYTGTLDDGTEFDSSYNRGEPLEFVCGVGMMIPGFDKKVVDMEVGDVAEVHIEPAEAYGEQDPDAIFTVDFEQMEGAEGLNVGERVYLTNQYGQQFPVTVTAKTDVNITFDANHELAGKALNFKIELVSVED